MGVDSFGLSVIRFSAGEGDAGCRLDKVLAARYPLLSRSYVRQLIRQRDILVNDTPAKPAYILRDGDTVRGEISPLPDACHPKPEPIPLHILFEDSHVLVVNKAPGRVVHPAPGHGSATLVNALLHHFPPVCKVGDPARPGIVHRLDKDTSGTLIIAKTNLAYQVLQKQFKDRSVRKRYLALVYGHPDQTAGRIRIPVGRHPVDRKKMSPSIAGGRSAETGWSVHTVLDSSTLLDVHIRTGRTHQIRVHCAAMGHPVVGDRRYGGKRRWKEASDTARGILKSAKRQMLHAWRLSCTHPSTGEKLRFESPLPRDMSEMITALKTLDR